MSRKAITQATYTAMLEAFREDPGNCAYVHRKTGVMRETAKKAWNVGWPFKAMKPIRIALEEEMLAARAALQNEMRAKAEKAEADRAAARQQAIQARAQEGSMVALARMSSAIALKTSMELAQGAAKLADQTKHALIREAAKQPADQMAPSAAVHLLERIAGVLGKINASAHEAMQMERLHLGQPTDIIGVIDGTNIEDMTLQEAHVRIEAAQQALVAAERAATKLKAIEGGASANENDNEGGGDDEEADQAAMA